MSVLLAFFHGSARKDENIENSQLCNALFDLQAQTEHHGDSAHSHRWTSLELVKGSYSTDDSPSDIAEIRLDKAVPLKVI